MRKNEESGNLATRDREAGYGPDRLISYMLQFAGVVIMSYSSNWFTSMLLCTSAPYRFCVFDLFHLGSRQHDPVSLAMEEYGCWQMFVLHMFEEDIKNSLTLINNSLFLTQYFGETLSPS